MEDYKEMILRLFGNGASIEGITSIIHSQLKESESMKKPSERIKFNRRDAKKMVEQTILDDYLKKQKAVY